MNIETLDQLQQALERATKAIEGLKIEIATSDDDGINVESTELVKAMLALDELFREVLEWQRT